MQLSGTLSENAICSWRPLDLFPTSFILKLAHPASPTLVYLLELIGWSRRGWAICGPVAYLLLFIIKTLPCGYNCLETSGALQKCLIDDKLEHTNLCAILLTPTPYTFEQRTSDGVKYPSYASQFETNGMADLSRNGQIGTTLRPAR